MSGGKFSKILTRPRSAIGTRGEVMATYEGGVGYGRDPKSELFLLAVTNLVSEDTFYEVAEDRDRRFVRLVRTVTRQDPLWVSKFIPFLRNTMQMRSAAIVAAVEYGRAYAGDPEAAGLSRPQVVASALARSDEPGQMLAYFVARYGRAVPTWLKRGINLALPSLYTERAVLKYDGGERRWRFGDVIALTHPMPQTAKAAALYRFLSLSRYGKGWEWLRADENAQQLPMLASWDTLNRLELPQRRALVVEGNAALIGSAGITWERLSGWLQGPMDAAAWTLVIPSMGYMALLRNLRNFEDAGVPEAAMQTVAEKLINADEVRASRQFPLRFYSAYKNLRSERFGRALETALELSVSNIPLLPGKTLIMVDCSGSMNSRLSQKSELLRWEAAALFGTALAKRCERADLYAYSDTAQRIAFSGPTLRLLPSFMQWPGAGRGTRTWDATAAGFKGHDRIVILTDEQAWPLAGWNRSAPPKIPARNVYTWNLAGYSAAHNEQGKDGSYVFGGLTDAGFRMLSLLEAGQDAAWPFLES